MIKQEQYLEKFLKEFLQSALITCKNEILHDSEKYSKIIKVPILKNDRLVDIQTKKIMDFNRLVYEIKKEIKKYPKINSLITIIKNIFKNQKQILEKKNKFNLDIDLESFTDEQLFNFILHYLKNNGIEFTNTNFKKTLTSFYQYINDDIFSYYYLTPLFNVEGNFKEIILSDNLWIRQLSNEEYSKIINIENLPMKEILPHQKKLKYVLINKIVRKKNLELKQIAIENFENTVNILKLFSNANPQFGNLYWIASQDWEVENIILIERGHEKPSSSKKYVISKNESKKFATFYANINKKIFNLKESAFLISSIRRFGMASHHRKNVDKIVEHVISLESLLIPGIGDSTLKLAHRLASILGESDKERLWIWHFVKEAYKFRSGILHQSKERSFKINSNILDLDNVSQNLEMYNRKALLRTLQLLDYYPSQKLLTDELDKSMYDREKLEKLQNYFKN